MPTVTVDGVDIAYEATGDGPAVLFTHGFQASRAMWASQRAALEPTHRVITWDLRGHGDSDDPDDAGRYSHELYVFDIDALLKELDAAPAALVGHSMGGFASLRYYLDHPDKVRALVLFGSGPGYRDPEAREKWNTMAERSAQAMEKGGLGLLQRAGLEVRTAKHRSAQGLAHAARGMLAQFDSRVMDALADIAVPTLLIVGTEDRNFIRSSEYMARKIPGARLEMIEGAGHAANIEHADEFNRVLLDFLGSL